MSGPRISPVRASDVGIFGIMGITKLNDTRVKRGFEANKPGFDADSDR